MSTHISSYVTTSILSGVIADESFPQVSKLSKIRKPSLMVPLPGPYVKSVLSKIGLPCGALGSGRPNTSTPFWTHAMLDYVMTLIGSPSLFISYTHNLHKDIRRRAIRKAERDAKKA